MRKGGISGRKINFVSYDDAYSPPKTVEQARKLVESDEVLFIFNPLGTPPNSAIQKYMNTKKVPQLFVATGATKWNDLGVVPLGGAGGAEQLRHLLGVHLFLSSRIRWRAQRIEDEEHLVALHQLACLLHRLRRAVRVVIADEIDLAAVDAAFGIDLVEVGLFGFADHAVSGNGAAVG